MIGSTDGCPPMIGVGRILMVAAADVDVDVSLVASVVTDDVDPPIVVSSVWLLKTLSMSDPRLAVGSAVVIGVSSGASVGPIGVACRTVLTETPSVATAPDPLALGFPPAIAALVSAQAAPTVRKASTWAPRSGVAHAFGLAADVLSPVTSEVVAEVGTTGVAW